MTLLGIFDELLSIRNVNVARCARNLAKWDFFAIFKHRVKATKRKNETSKSTTNEPIFSKIQKIQTPPPMTQNTSKATDTSDTPKNQELNEVDEVIDSATICGSCSKSGDKSVISRCNICDLKCHLDCMVIVQNQKVCDGCKPIFV